MGTGRSGIARGPVRARARQLNMFIQLRVRPRSTRHAGPPRGEQGGEAGPVRGAACTPTTAVQSEAPAPRGFERGLAVQEIT